MSTKNKAPGRDPHRAREARRYARPIASREHILETLAAAPGPLDFAALAKRLAIADDGARVALERRLGAMVRDGQLRRTRGGGWAPVGRLDLVRGRVIGHRDGFGFLVPDQGGDDLFLPPRQMRSLLHGDRAVVRIAGIDARGRAEASLVEVIERANASVVGRYFVEGGVGLVRPDNARLHQDVVVPAGESGAAEPGQYVVAAIVEPPGKHNPPIGRVAEVIGDRLAPGMEIDVAIRAHGIPDAFVEEAITEAAAFGSRIPRAARRGRVDLRDLPLLTIDGADARDFDDAVYCRPTPKGWKLWVAIADVAAYVAPGGALDSCARSRGTSVYFPDRVVPMLPESLSNGLCSLNPDQDRLCVVAELLIDGRGETVRARFLEAVMRSHARLTYDQAAAIAVARDPEARRAHEAVNTTLDQLYRLYKALAGARRRRGTLDLDLPETAVVMDSSRRIDRIERRDRNDAHRLIEECMIAANVAAARHLARHRMATLYRVHEGPSAERLEELRAFLGELGLSLGGGERPRPRHYQRLLGSIAGRPEALLVQSVLLRSLAQAVYSPVNGGHFGLALPCYAHFTSPIRRYPDLMVHRALKHLIGGGRAADFGYTREQMVALGEHTSMTERRADEATRDALDRLKCEYMMGRIGEEYAATVSAVVSFGLFVTLDEVFVEGLVHISALGADYFHFDPVHYRLSGERSGRHYRLADRLRVRVARVDPEERKIDFELVSEGGAGKRNRRAASKPARRGRSKR